MLHIENMSDEISDLRLFERIVMSGSLSAAARQLRASPAMVSRRLSAMEARLGVRLLDRSARKFKLTEEGLVLHARAAAIVTAVEEAEAEAMAATDTARGRVRVTAPQEIGRCRIATLIADFAIAHPQVEIEFVVTDERLSVRDEDIDVAIQTKQPTDGDVICRKLIESRRIVCASPAYLSSNGAPSTLEELAEHDCIRMVRGFEIYDRWRFHDGGRERLVKVSGRLIANSSDVIHGWVLEGRGIAVKALWDIEEDLSAGRLVHVLPEFAIDDINLYATFSSRTHLPPRIRLLLDHLAAGLRRQMSGQIATTF